MRSSVIPNGLSQVDSDCAHDVPLRLLVGGETVKVYVKRGRRSEGRMSILRGGFLGCFPFPATCSKFLRRCLVPNGSRPVCMGKLHLSLTPPHHTQNKQRAFEIHEPQCPNEVNIEEEGEVVEVSQKHHFTLSYRKPLFQEALEASSTSTFILNNN
jgi:hypothetical protein